MSYEMEGKIGAINLGGDEGEEILISAFFTIAYCLLPLEDGTAR